MKLTPRVVAALFMKDLLDAVRDTRIVVMLLTPLAMGLLFNFTLPSSDRVALTVAYARIDAESDALVDRLVAALPPVFDVERTPLGTDDEVREAVRERRADVGIGAPADVLTAVRAGAVPRVSFVARERSSRVEVTLRQLELVLLQAGERAPPAILEPVLVERQAERPAKTLLDLRAEFLLAILAISIASTALVVLPMLLAEESERKTLDALLQVGSYLDVVVAKTLVGASYVAAGVVILISLTRVAVADVPGLAFAIGLATLALVATGLLLGGLFRSSNQVYTWSSFFLMPAMAAPFLATLPELPAWLAGLARAIPTGAVMPLLVNASSGRAVHDDAWISVALLTAWSAVALAALAWRLARREG